MSKSISIVIPALNEEAAIGKTIKDVRSVLENAVDGLEIIVVNDGSTDSTVQIAEGLGVKVIHHPEPVGYGASLKDGIIAANHDIIGIIDADGTYPVNYFPELLAYLPKYDMAVGARTGKEYRGTFLKSPARQLFQWLCEFVTGQKIPDINSGLRIFKKEKVLLYFDTLCRGFSFTTTITLAFLLNGLFVRYVPIPYYKRIGESKVRYFRDTLRTAQIIVEAILYYNPIKLFIILGGMAFLIGLISFIVAILSTSLFYLLGGISVLGSLLLLALGFLADLIRKNKSI